MGTKVPNPVDKYVGSRVRMRRRMLGMSQVKLADKLRLTFQQVQKYEKGTNRISATRLQEMSYILQVPVPFFFEGAPQIAGCVGKDAEAPSPAYVSDFLANSDGLKLVRAFTQIGDAELRRSLSASSRKSSVRATTKRWYAKFTSRILEDWRVLWGLVERRRGLVAPASRGAGGTGAPVFGRRATKYSRCTHPEMFELRVTPQRRSGCGRAHYAASCHHRLHFP